jgi:hypothetical protein
MLCPGRALRCGIRCIPVESSSRRSPACKRQRNQLCLCETGRISRPFDHSPLRRLLASAPLRHRDWVATKGMRTISQYQSLPTLLHEICIPFWKVNTCSSRRSPRRLLERHTQCRSAVLDGGLHSKLSVEVEHASFDLPGLKSSRYKGQCAVRDTQTISISD